MTELVAACAYNSIANGVGRFSFTHALNVKLRQMANLPYFTVGHLYNAIFTEIQGWRIEEAEHRKIPVHLVLSQSAMWPRSIKLPNFAEENGKLRELHTPTISLVGKCSASGHLEIPPTSETPDLSSAPPESNSPSSQQPSLSSSATSVSQLPEYPRLLFSVRLSEDVKPAELSAELFKDWLRSVPVSADLVRVEAGFASDSTIMLFSIPPSMLAYLPQDPAITLLGSIRSTNLMIHHQTSLSTVAEETKTGLEHKSALAASLKPLRGITETKSRNALGDIFAEIGLSQYLQNFLDQGFNTWDAIISITELDLDALGVKLGDRRKLQRKIASSRALTPDSALLLTPLATPASSILTSSNESEAKHSTLKNPTELKHRRHPKPHENAPEAPSFAWVIFLQRMHEELRGRILSLYRESGTC